MPSSCAASASSSSTTLSPAGESLAAVEKLVEEAGGIIAGRMAILAEGDAQNRDDIIYLEKLPVFHADGTIKE